MFRIVLLLLPESERAICCATGRLWPGWSGEYRLPCGPCSSFFGVTIGSNRELIVNFGRFGWQAAVIACLGVAGSFAAVFVVRRYFFRKGGSDER